jgi:hypothetical protein
MTRATRSPAPNGGKPSFGLATEEPGSRPVTGLPELGRRIPISQTGNPPPIFFSSRCDGL